MQGFMVYNNHPCPQALPWSCVVIDHKSLTTMHCYELFLSLLSHCNLRIDIHRLYCPSCYRGTGVSIDKNPANTPHSASRTTNECVIIQWYIRSNAHIHSWVLVVSIIVVLYFSLPSVLIKSKQKVTDRWSVVHQKVFLLKRTLVKSLADCMCYMSQLTLFMCTNSATD